jgi:hypothetical protein
MIRIEAGDCMGWNPAASYLYILKQINAVEQILRYRLAQMPGKIGSG